MSNSKVGEYPTSRDIDALVHDASAVDLRRAMARMGVFVVAPKERISKYLARFDFRRSFYVHAFESEAGDSSGTSITGIRTVAKDFESVVAAAELLVGDTVSGVPHGPTVLNVETDREGSRHVVYVEYVHVRPGRAAIFSRETRALTLILRHSSRSGPEQLADGTIVEVVCSPNSATDAVVARGCIQKILLQANAGAEPLSLDVLPLDGKVELFDRVFKSGKASTTGWRVENICRLKVRGDDSDSQRSDGGHDDDEGEVSQHQIASLQSAVFSGMHLREDEYVKGLLARGYYFSSCTFWARRFDVASQHKVRVSIEFKARPRVLVVSASDVSLLSTGELVELPRQERRTIENEPAEFFWNMVHRFHSEITESVLSASRNVQGS